MKRKLAFSTLGCPGWTLPQVVEAARSLGFGAIEIRGIGPELRSECIPDFLPQNREATRRLLEEAGVKVCVLGTSASFHDPAAVPAALAEGRAAIDLCAAMGISAIRVFGDRWMPSETPETTVERVARGIGQLCSYAAPLGVDVLLEVHGDFNRAEALLPVAQLTQSPANFGLIWDVEHSHRAYGRDFLPFYRAIAPWVRHLHCKDCVMQGDQARCVLPGDGEVPLGDILHALRAAGYDGWLSFEWEKRWVPELEEPEVALPAYVRHMAQWMGAE